MNKRMIIGALLSLGLTGCATHGCDTSVAGSPCRADYLLYQNDMLQAKLLINERRAENDELASALLARAAREDTSGEAEFYQAILLLRQNASPKQVDAKLDDSADRNYPLAIALQAQRAGTEDQDKARAYRARYEKLDVATSGYPSFPQALIVVNQLISTAN
ncbi:hypothetical protein [Pseudomonas sp. CFBP 8772]|uniref:hypothetical protein n=1 Tax=Pseudomonas sp. CFBP 8772 TaxID=2775284 RepID=UPI00177EDCC5|nr:hypothetical protein [Pseudomonas sp. CFBP 8772]MBD8599442.1 hypothetical protein [Pseudomonas sp. CFBP 8772]